MGLVEPEELERHPKVGASLEGFALDQIVTRLGARPEECFHWATHTGAELDLLILRGNHRLGFELKRSAAPATNRSMNTAIASLRLDRLDVVYPGSRTYPLVSRIRVVGIERLLEDLEPL